jgi:TolB-like protein
VLGLPLVLFLAWAFELTPEGIKRDEDVDRSQSTVTRSGLKIDRTIIAVLLVALAWFAWDRFFSGEDELAAPTAEATTAEAPAVTQKSVAVLPFIAMSSGPDDGYFADGLTEEILNSLAGLPELLVTARTSAFSFKGKDLPVQEIATTLNVNHIVEGSVRRSADRLRVTAQLIRADDGFHLWSETYDRDAGDTFTIQTDIAEKIATALDVVLDEQRRAAMAISNVRNPEAFVAYQKGLELHYRAHGFLPQLPTLAEANAYFERAVELEPGFYSAYLAHTDLYTHTLIDFATGEPGVAHLGEQALADARLALEADLEAGIRSAPDRARRTNTEYDQAVLLGNWRGLAGLTDRMLDGDDDCFVPEWHNLTTFAFGRAAEALRDYSAVIACDPLMDRTRFHRTLGIMWSKDFDRAISIAGPDYGDVSSYNMTVAYTDVLIAVGRIDEVRSFVDTQVRDASIAQAVRLSVAAFEGDAAAADRIAAERFDPSGGSGRERIFFAARMGDRDTANEFAALIDSRPFGYIPLLQAIYFCLCGAPFDLDATPTFAAMLDESGLPWPPEKVIDWPLKDW